MITARNVNGKLVFDCEEDRQHVRRNIERVLSEIFSDVYECKLTLHFGPEPKE